MSRDSQLYQSISIWNDEGVALLRRKSVGAAKSCFRKALAGLVADERANAFALTPSYGEQMEQTWSSDFSDQVLAPTYWSDCLHCHPFALNFQRREDSQIALAVILFNLALTFHIQGDGGESDYCRTRLVKSTRLYDNAKAILDCADVATCHNFGIGNVYLLNMALLNNMGYATYALGDYQSSALLYHELTLFLQPLHAGKGSLLRELKGRFLLNAAFLQPPQIAPAA